MTALERIKSKIEKRLLTVDSQLNSEFLLHDEDTRNMFLQEKHSLNWFVREIDLEIQKENQDENEK
jgi:hypothetical protein